MLDKYSLISTPSLERAATRALTEPTIPLLQSAKVSSHARWYILSIYHGGSILRTAKLFKNGRSQAVRLPAEFRFAGDEVYIRRVAETGDVVLSQRRGWSSWDEYFGARDARLVPDDFVAARRDEKPQARKLFGKR